MEDLNLWEIYRTIKEGCHMVELSRELNKDTPHWDGYPGMEMRTLFDFDKDNSGFRAHMYSVVGQCGTHIDAPRHYDSTGRALDQVPLCEMVLPLCVIKLSTVVMNNPDYALSAKDIIAWEEKHGRIPDGAFVAFHSGWGNRSTIEEINNCDENGRFHYPGWSMEALHFLIENRNVTAIGHETSDTDPASVVAAAGWIGESYFLHQGHYQVEMMVNLDQCPEVGGIIFCTFPKITGGSGFSARCFALVPNGT